MNAVNSRSPSQVVALRGFGSPIALSGEGVARGKTRRNRRLLSTTERFWPRVDRNGPIPAHAPHLGPCWIWTGSTDSKGYGQIGINGRGRKAHIALHGLAPFGLEWDHLCRNRQCVGPIEGPSHIEAVTHKENLHRAIGCSWQLQAAQTHCKRGHEFTPENTRIETSGGRRCLTCDAARSRRRYPDRRDYYRDRYLAQKAASR